MLYRNITMGELFDNTPYTETVNLFFTEGLRTGNHLLAISAMEELIRRGDIGLVEEGLNKACENGEIKVNSTTSKTIARFCAEDDIDDAFLRRFGKYLNLDTIDEGEPLDLVFLSGKDQASVFLHHPRFDELKEGIKRLIIRKLLE